MKPEELGRELRVGNLIDSKNGIITVDHHIINLLFAESECDELPWKDDLEDIKPIPITEEWLLKFGFKQRDCASISYSIIHLGEEFDYYVCTMAEEGLFTYRNDNIEGDYGIEIRYIHQLQNLYFALTGEELTINQP